MKKIIAAMLLLAAGAAHAGVIELVKNGSFEKNGVAANSWNIKYALDGWTVGANGAEVRNNVAVAEYEKSIQVEFREVVDALSGRFHVTEETVDHTPERMVFKLPRELVA